MSTENAFISTGGGQLTDELKGDMTEFVTLGPKTYCYKERMKDGSEKVTRKAKGISLTSEAGKKVTYEQMKTMVEEVLTAQAQRTAVNVPQQSVRRSKFNDVYFKDTLKTFRYTFSKRRVLSDGSTLPFGYCDY